MAQVAIFFHNHRNRRVLADWITGHTDYDAVEITDGSDLIDRSFDLCLLDGYCLEQYSDPLDQVKTEAEPQFVPYLLLIERQQAQRLDTAVWERVDDIIWQSATSLSSADSQQFRFELRGRLQSLLNRRDSSIQLDRQRNLVQVLNRVLRHNLRNDMSVIRGMVTLLADESDASGDYADTATENIDKLIDLSEKARQLESLISVDQETYEIDIDQMLARIVDDIQSEYPVVSISLDTGDEVLVHTKSSIETALSEVIENAAKHAGEQPTIDIRTEVTGDSVQVQVSDDGPGLPTQEQEVLQTGNETPLSHGSGLGLWMVYWIITDLGGTINSTATDDGTTVTLSLPRPSAGTGEDVEPSTELRIKRSQERFKAVFENAHEPILLVDDERRIITANPSTAELFGVPRRDLFGRRLREFVSNDRDIDRVWKTFQTAKHDRGEFRIERSGDGERVVEYRATNEIAPEQHLFLLCDITDRKQREHELERQIERLDEFASVVSHDLRNPLNVAQGRLALAQADGTSEHLDLIEQSLDRMAELIEDLLILAQQGDSIADVATVELSAVVEGCWETIETADAELSIETECRFEADESRVRQLFENLFRNAVEHGGDGVTVTVGDLADGTGLFIEDDGPGIPPSERDQVFNSGYSTKQNGTGFGLNIVKRVADAHEWEITVTEGSEGGARFEITGVEFVAE